MLEIVKTKLGKMYKKTDCRGVFLSAFSSAGDLLGSHGVFQTDKPLDETLDTLRHGLFVRQEHSIELVAVDIVLDSYHETDPAKLLALSPKIYGLFVATQDTSQSAVLLPDTVGIADMKHALYVLKQKYPFLSGHVHIFPFTTDRIVVKR